MAVDGEPPVDEVVSGEAEAEASGVARQGEEEALAVDAGVVSREAEVHREDGVASGVDEVADVVVSVAHDLYVCIAVHYLIPSLAFRPYGLFVPCVVRTVSWFQSFDFGRNCCKSCRPLVLCGNSLANHVSTPKRI